MHHADAELTIARDVLRTRRRIAMQPLGPGCSRLTSSPAIPQRGRGVGEVRPARAGGRPAMRSSRRARDTNVRERPQVRGANRVAGRMGGSCGLFVQRDCVGARSGRPSSGTEAQDARDQP